MTALRLPNVTDPDHPADAIVGEWVLVLMRRKHLTQKAVAAHLGIDQASFGRKIAGRRPWQLRELQIVAGVLGTDVPSLCAGLPELDSNQQPSGYPLALVRPLAEVVSLDAWRAA